MIDDSHLIKEGINSNIFLLILFGMFEFCVKDNSKCDEIDNQNQTFADRGDYEFDFVDIECY